MSADQERPTRSRHDARRRRRRKPLGTIWEVPDASVGADPADPREFWPRKPTGRRIANWRDAQRDHLPDADRLPVGPTPRKFGPKSTVHDWFQRWAEGGVFERIWAVLVAECDELGGVDWQWQSGRRGAGQGPVRGEKDGQEPHRPRQEGHQEEHAGRRRRRAAGGGDRRGQRPRAEAAEGDDRGDRGRAARAGGGGAAPVPGQGLRQPQRRAAAAEAGYIPHIRRIGEERKPCDRSKGHKPRRWVVERTFAWLSKCRGLLVRYDKKDGNYLGLIQLACGLLLVSAAGPPTAE